MYSTHHLTKLSEAIGFVTTKLGLLKTAAVGIGAVLGAQNIGRPKMFGLFKYADSDKCSCGYTSFLIA
jgi:hypothetical protein